MDLNRGADSRSTAGERRATGRWMARDRRADGRDRRASGGGPAGEWRGTVGGMAVDPRTSTDNPVFETPIDWTAGDVLPLHTTMKTKNKK